MTTMDDVTAVAAPSTPRSSRRSSHMHEIQPPARRLSAHQVLLLTPFGGTVPLEQSTMGRERSSLGSSLPRKSNLRAMSMSMSISPSSMPTSSGMGREPSNGPPSPRSTYTPPIPRTRHSLAVSPGAPSPLSQPMTTIVSNSDKGSEPSSAAASREASGGGEDDEGAQIGTVKMTRSNSLPVLTLRELEAMKDKDTELGIARGGDWAWVGREDEDDMETPGLSDASTLSSTPPSFPFNDPFASTQGTYRRTEETARFGSYQPVATAEGYHYSPSSSRDRRVSDIPPPVATSPTNTQTTPRAGASSGLESPRGTHMPAIQRPKITRYKTSPALSLGLGLSVVVRPEPEQVGVQIHADAGGSLGRRGRKINLSTVERREQRHAQLRDDNRGEFGERRGSWTPVDIVDGLELHRSSVSSSSSRGSFAYPRNSISSSTSSRHIVLVESTRAMSIGSGSFATRSRVDSLDSPKGKLADIQDIVRRGSAGVSGALGPWRLRPDETRRGSGEEVKGDWYERRGSWAAGWKKD